MDEAKSVLQVAVHLVARLDNITAVFEKDLLSSIQFTRNVVHRWDASYKENQALSSLVTSYEKNLTVMRQHHREVKGKLVETRSQIASLVVKKEEILREKHLLKKNDEGTQDDPALSISSVSLGSSLNKRLSECGLHVGKTVVTKDLTPFKSLSAISSSPWRVLSKKHFFFPKTVFFGETCEVCSKRIGFAKVMLRCLDCGVKMHQQCRDSDFQNCVPRVANFKCRRRLMDYIPPREPFIPKMVIDLVNEIECRGLDYAGLYRVPGPESKVKNLLYKFLYERGRPNVRTISDVAVLTGCLKKFFQQLVEPLIPFTSRDEFMSIAVQDIGLRAQMKRIHKEIVELPLPSQHTLAFLLIHLQKVSERSETNKMTISNLARVFGPTVVGTFSQANISLSDMLNEAAKQEKVMTLLLSLPRQYLMQYIDSKKANRFRADDFDLPGTSRDCSPLLTEKKTLTWTKPEN
ncbi:rac GTPase activating protein 1 [Trichuris trichiura]|uniref:Rac GTPase activating protein 1 n=1 Tax=Trichuris trichiura TaxID=36087 RepID=A0A077Z228_TRITR|nr:rac GTPase activating protein 1 [Trichuris trichiura]